MARILIVDDDEQVRTMLRITLQREGYEVSEAANGSEATRLYRAQPGGVVITDIIMPEKEGIGTILELRKDFPDVQIIAISGGGKNDPEDYLKVARTLGAKYTFVKPVDRTELLAAVKNLAVLAPVEV
ncbi:MAG: response regulator [bacterium]